MSHRRPDEEIANRRRQPAHGFREMKSTDVDPRHLDICHPLLNALRAPMSRTDILAKPE